MRGLLTREENDVITCHSLKAAACFIHTMQRNAAAVTAAIAA